MVLSNAIKIQDHVATAEQSHALQAAHGLARAQAKESALLEQLNHKVAATAAHNQEHAHHPVAGVFGEPAQLFVVMALLKALKPATARQEHAEIAEQKHAQQAALGQEHVQAREFALLE